MTGFMSLSVGPITFRKRYELSALYMDVGDQGADEFSDARVSVRNIGMRRSGPGIRFLNGRIRHLSANSRHFLFAQLGLSRRRFASSTALMRLSDRPIHRVIVIKGVGTKDAL